MRGRASVQGKAQLPGKETLLSVVANSPMSNTVRHCFVLLVFAGGMMALLLSAGCGTLTNGRSWGQDAVFPGDLKNISRAAHDAFFDLQTLIPAAGALIFAIDDFDDRVSDWASDHNPIFGSDENAQDASDVLRNVLLAEFFVTALATPSGDDPKKWAYAKSKGLAVELAALGTTLGATGLLKVATDRERPDESNNNSFPSGHSSASFSAATLANRNFDSIRLPKKFKRPIQVGNLILATSVAWARVEGAKHFPSDVLAGAALGYFITAFIHDAFLGLPDEDRFGFVIISLDGGAAAQLSFHF
jgi:hypothetical protein